MSEEVVERPRRVLTAPGRYVVMAIVVGSLVISIVMVQLFSRMRHGFDPRARCQMNLRVLHSALVRYQEAHGRLPPTVIADGQGKPLYSWRVLLVPYLPEDDAKAIADKFHLDQAWDGPDNTLLVRPYMPLTFSCPENLRVDQFGPTRFVAATGPGSVWDAGGTKPLKGYGRVPIVVEYLADDIAWTEPRDVALEDVPTDTLSNESEGRSILVLYADGTIDRRSARP